MTVLVVRNRLLELIRISPKYGMVQYNVLTTIFRIHLVKQFYYDEGISINHFYSSTNNNFQMQKNNWEKFTAIPSLQGLAQSTQHMTSQQIDLNIVELSICSIYNHHIFDFLSKKMSDHCFYVRYRYLLEKVLNGSLDEKHKKGKQVAADKYDEVFINGKEEELTQQNVMNLPFLKEKRVKYFEKWSKFVQLLDELSENLFKIEEKTQKFTYFTTAIETINDFLSPKISQDEQILKIPLKNQNYKLQQISQQDSYFIQTKNRNPLVLNLGFGKVLYKDDNQISHEIIAYEMAKYLNKILGREYIVEYDVLPVKVGAFYQFIENALTINDIKKIHGGICEYFDHLVETTDANKQNLLNNFAQSYSGFCIFQYLLQIKDRNNANLMIKSDGSIFHIDLTFIFESGPGGISFESAPFKMTKQYVEVLGGFNSDSFKKYQTLMVQHFTKLFESREEFKFKMKALSARSKQIKCFNGYKMSYFKDKMPKKQSKIKEIVEDLIDRSYDSFKTNKYDDFQFKSNDILK